jgi:hypothetical protein
MLYIDAGTGGIMLQVLLSGVVGGLVFFRLAAKRIVDFVLRRDPDAGFDSPAATTDESEDSESRAA